MAPGVTNQRPSWDEYFMGLAWTVAKRSTCLRVPDGVGAIIALNNQILSTGYAGSLRGQPHCTEVGCLIDERTGGCIRTVHAEVNAIVQSAQHGVRISGATIYTTMSPCWDCFKAIVNGGIVRVVYDVEYRLVEPQLTFAKNCGVEFKHLSDRKYKSV